MARERQPPRGVPFNPTRPLSELDPAPSLVENLQGDGGPSDRMEPIRHSTIIFDIAWDPYLYVKNDLRTWPAASEAKIWTPGPNNITLTFVPSLSDRSKDPSEFIQSLPQYKKHCANPDSKRNILPTVLYPTHTYGGSGDGGNTPLLHPPPKHKYADNGDKANATLTSWVRKLLCCVSPRKVITSPYISYGGSDSKYPLVLQTPFP